MRLIPEGFSWKYCNVYVELLIFTSLVCTSVNVKFISKTNSINFDRIDFENKFNQSLNIQHVRILDFLLFISMTPRRYIKQKSTLVSLNRKFHL